MVFSSDIKRSEKNLKLCHLHSKPPDAAGLKSYLSKMMIEGKEAAKVLLFSMLPSPCPLSSLSALGEKA